MRSMPSTVKWRAYATWRGSRCRAKSACSGGATCCTASAAGRRAPIRSRPALLAAIGQHHVAPAKLIDLIDARRFDLYDEPMAGIADLEAYARRTSSALFALAAQILSGSEAEAVAEPAGIAYAIVGLLRALPLHAARRQLYVPMEVLERHQVRTEDLFAGRSGPGLNAALAELRNLAGQHLAAASERMAELPSAALPAFLPLALVRPWLARLERSDAFAPARYRAMAAAMADLARGTKSGAHRAVDSRPARNSVEDHSAACRDGPCDPRVEVARVRGWKRPASDRAPCHCQAAGTSRN